jgi:hypothetical protein
MATKKTRTPRKIKPKPKQGLRNAAAVSAMHRPRPATKIEKEPTDWRHRAWQVAKLGGGMLAGALTCAYVARQDWLPPKTITAATTAVGGALAVGGETDTLRWIGAGAAAAAGGQLLLLAVDDQLHSRPPEQVATKDKPPIKKPSNADGLPPGALEAAYERARRRLAMTQADGVAA